jgi:hypothetical protein
LSEVCVVTELEREPAKEAFAFSYTGGAKIGWKSESPACFVVEREGGRWKSKLVENCRESIERCRAPKKSGGAFEGLHLPTLTMRGEKPCIV